ncbi:MAG TPA: acylphosphatase [Thermoplasmata archaeon]|nr:acylphosphatase [Thermoplasmata archaeon]
MNAGEGPVEHWRLRATGRVQGVGYRERVRRAAQALGLSGEVWNEADGSVLVDVQGPVRRLEALAVRIGGRYGASDAERVDRLERSPARTVGPGFTVRI